MKLLLTSAGLTNETIVTAIKDLVERPFEELSVAFIPTAANVEEGDKSWLVEDMVNVEKLKWNSFDVVDFSALPQSLWEKRLSSVDVLVFGGGSSYYLIETFETSGLKEVFEKIMSGKVYVGISAGSMIATKDVQVGWDRDFYGIESPEDTEKGLGLVDFHIMPHLNLSAFPKVTRENIEMLSKKVEGPIYAIDNDTAIVVTDDNISVVSEGEWEKFE